MPNVTAYCYLISLFFYALGFLKTWAIKNAVSEHLVDYNVTFNVSMATGYFVLTILLAVIGSFFLFVKYSANQECLRRRDIRIKENVSINPYNIRQAS